MLLLLTCVRYFHNNIVFFLIFLSFSYKKGPLVLILTTAGLCLGQRCDQFLPGNVFGVQDVTPNNTKSNKLLQMITHANNENHDLKAVSIVQGDACTLLITVWLGWGEEGCRSRTEKRCSYNLKSGPLKMWLAEF